MIAVSGKLKQFRQFVTYLVKDGPAPGRVAWIAVRNLPTTEPHLASLFMRATAAHSSRIVSPAYHVALSFAPEDPVDRAIMERIADKVLDRLRLGEYQALLVAHRDQPHHPHLHILVNRIHPETGRAWIGWRDRAAINWVLRREERALGLRPLQTRVLKADELSREVEAYERVVALEGARQHARAEATTARARTDELVLLTERVHAALARRDQALASVYRAPEGAYHAYVALAEREGRAAATPVMREHPERFGALIAGERTHGFGLLHTVDDGPARRAAPAAAAAAHEGFEATRAWRTAVEAEARRLEQAFERDLGGIYASPAAARAAFERLAGESCERAAAALRERPDALAPLLPGHVENPRATQQRARTASCGLLALEARAFAHTAERDLGVVRTPRVDHDAIDRARDRERAIEAELHTLPARGDLERHLSAAFEQLLPRDARFLHRVLTPSQRALISRLPGLAADFDLGREDDRDLSLVGP